MFKIFEKLYDKKVDSIGLALFRIAYFMVLFFELIQMYYFKNLIFDRIPFVQVNEINLGIPLFVWIVCCFFLVIGLFTRAMVLLNYAFTLVFISTISTFEYHVFYTYTSVNLLCLFLPISQQLSLDRLIEKLKYSNTRFQYTPPITTTSLSYTIPIMITIGFVYFDSVFYKTVSVFWMKGLGVWLPSSFPQISITSTSGIAGFLINNFYLTKFFGYLTLVFETVFLFLFWFKKFRTPFFIIGIGLHLGILISFPIPWFALAVVAAYFLLLPIGYYRRIGHFLFKKRKTLLSFYYDQECPLCIRTKIIIEHFDIFKNIEFKSVQAHSTDVAVKDIDYNELLNNIYSVRANGTIQYGVDTYIRVLEALRFTFPLALILRVPGIYHLAKRIYNYIATNRIVERCTEDNCGYTPPVVPQDVDTIKILNHLTFKKIRVAGIAAGIVFISILQIFISYTSGLSNVIRDKSGISSNPISQTMIKLSNISNVYGKYFAGLTHHPVFMDSHFHEYDHIIAISYESPNGEEIWLPIIDKTGSPDYYVTGPNWVKWSFRVNSPGKIPYKQFEEGVQRFTAFWAHKNGKMTKKAKFKIHLKKIEVPKEFEYGFLERQRAKEWVDMGTILWIENQCAVNISEPYLVLFKF